MEPGIKKYKFKLLVVFILILVATNAVNFFFFRTKAGTALFPDRPTTIIKYEPKGPGLESGTEAIIEAINVITNSYYYPVEKEVLVEGAVRGMIRGIGDPYNRFYNSEELEEFLTETRGSYGGIGVRIIEVDNSVVVFETFTSSPAERSGIAPGDRIIEADGNDLTGEGINYAVELLRGPSNTTVEIVIKRPGADDPIRLTVEREEIRVNTVSSEILEDGLALINISSFDSNTAAEFSEQIRNLEQGGLHGGLILDLRNNPGGLVDQAVEIAKLLVPEGEIVRLVGRNNEIIRVYYSSAVKKQYKIVVLINEDSASAAELLAGALQDREAAMLVGKTTFGKASVQQLEYISRDSAILLTIAKYFTPSGHDIDKYGIEPDYQVEMPEILRYYRYFHPGRLEKGSYGLEVEMLQRMLDQIGYTVEATGYYDAQTSLALSTFQAAAGLNVSGEFDDQTWIELRQALDRASREQDEQLHHAVELIKDPLLWTGAKGIE